MARLENLLPGQYVLEVEGEGFARAVRLIDVGDSGASIDISLALADVTERVVVTASGDVQQGSEVSKAVTVVARDEIQSRDLFSLADVLRTVPGLSVEQLGGPGAFATVTMRGMRAEDTSILIDGVRFRDAASPQGDAAAFISDLYVTDVDRLEILRGSGSSLYGTNAVAGVVNVISRTGIGRTSGDGAIENGSSGFTRGRAHAGGSGWAGRAAYSVGVAHTRVTRGVDGDDPARSTSVQGRADLRVATGARLTLRVYDANAASALNESPAAIGPLPRTGYVFARDGETFVPAADDPDSRRVSQFRSTLARFEHRPSARVGYTASWHHLTTERAFLDGPLGVGFEPLGHTRSDFDGRIDTVDGRLDRSWSLRQVTTVSYEFERERYVSHAAPVDPAAGWIARLTQNSHAFAVQHQVQLDALQIAAGIRAQRFSLDPAHFEPAERAPFAATSFTAPPSAFTADLSAARSIRTTATIVRAHVGNGYRAPSMFERAGASFGSRGYTVYGDPRLAPEQSFSMDAGAEQVMARRRLRVSAALFRTRLGRVIAFDSLDQASDPYGRRSGYRNADGRTARGVELSARAQPIAAVQMTAAYTYARADAPIGSPNGLPQAEGIPAHQLSATLIARAPRAPELSLQFESASPHYLTLFDPVSFASRAYRFDGLVKADAAASYVVPVGGQHIRVLGVVENILDRRYYVQGFRAPGRTARMGAEVRF